LISKLEADEDPLTLLTLSSDIILEIFDRLSPISSTCLGLTCKTFYTIHREIHGSVDLNTSSSYEITCPMGGESKIAEGKLHVFLHGWMWRGANLVWGGLYDLKFITVERFVSERLQEEAKKEEEKAERHALDIRLSRCLNRTVNENRLPHSSRISATLAAGSSVNQQQMAELNMDFRHILSKIHGIFASQQKRLERRSFEGQECSFMWALGIERVDISEAEAEFLKGKEIVGKHH